MNRKWRVSVCFFKAVVLSLSVLVGSVSFGSEVQPCESVFEVVQEFRYILSVAGSQLSIDQQKAL